MSLSSQSSDLSSPYSADMNYSAPTTLSYQGPTMELTNELRRLGFRTIPTAAEAAKELKRCYSIPVLTSTFDQWVARNLPVYQKHKITLVAPSRVVFNTLKRSASAIDDNTVDTPFEEVATPRKRAIAHTRKPLPMRGTYKVAVAPQIITNSADSAMEDHIDTPSKTMTTPIKYPASKMNDHTAQSPTQRFANPPESPASIMDDHNIESPAQRFANPSNSPAPAAMDDLVFNTNQLNHPASAMNEQVAESSSETVTNRSKRRERKVRKGSRGKVWKPLSYIVANYPYRKHPVSFQEAEDQEEDPLAIPDSLYGGKGIVSVKDAYQFACEQEGIDPDTYDSVMYRASYTRVQHNVRLEKFGGIGAVMRLGLQRDKIMAGLAGVSLIEWFDLPVNHRFPCKGQLPKGYTAEQWSASSKRCRHTFEASVLHEWEDQVKNKGMSEREAKIVTRENANEYVKEIVGIDAVKRTALFEDRQKAKEEGITLEEWLKNWSVQVEKGREVATKRGGWKKKGIVAAAAGENSGAGEKDGAGEKGGAGEDGPLGILKPNGQEVEDGDDEVMVDGDEM